jgi:hypothetical protein
MSSAALVVVCALNLLGRSASQFPPIVLLDLRPPGVSANAEGFVQRTQNVIYLLTDSPAFRAAREAEVTRGRCWHRESLMKIASVIVHEEWHLRHGPDERGAYQAQLTALALLGAGPGTRLHHYVKRSMQAVLEASRPAPEPVRLTRR